MGGGIRYVFKAQREGSVRRHSERDPVCVFGLLRRRAVAFRLEKFEEEEEEAPYHSQRDTVCLKENKCETKLPSFFGSIPK